MKAIKIFKIKDTAGMYVEIGAISKRDLEENLKDIDFSDTEIEFDRIKIEKSENYVNWFDKCDEYIEIVRLSNETELGYWTPIFEENLKKSDLELK